jgi:hypothetical protein
MMHKAHMQYSAVFRMVKQCKSALTSHKLVSAYSAYVSWRLLCMGGRGGGVCVNICVPSYPQVKLILVLHNKQGYLDLRRR